MRTFFRCVKCEFSTASPHTAVRVAMDSGAHHLFAVLVGAPALPSALVTLHSPVVAVLVAAGDVHPCKDGYMPSCKIFMPPAGSL